MTPCERRDLKQLRKIQALCKEGQDWEIDADAGYEVSFDSIEDKCRDEIGGIMLGIGKRIAREEEEEENEQL